MLDSPEKHKALARTRAVELIRKALIESCLGFRDVEASVSVEIQADVNLKMLIFDKTKLRRFIAYVESIAAQRTAGEEAIADVVYLLMRDESRLTTERATIFARTNEHAIYTKHLIKECRDTIVPALVEVQDFVRAIKSTDISAVKGPTSMIKSQELTSAYSMTTANMESSNKAQSAYACL